MKKHYGATSEDWTHFDLILGLGEDLLPVVSNTKATISAKSTMKALGKTPSLYNRERKAVGIANWTDKKTTASEIAKWEKEPDYGICLQTRHVRAFDIDVEGGARVAAIETTIRSFSALTLAPVRRRANSSKILLPFIVELPEREDLYKRVLQVQGGMIEVLCTGQQFIACGEHSSGVRYEWEGGLPAELPVVSLEKFEELCFVLETEFGQEAWRLASPRRKGSELQSPVVYDSILHHLDVLSWGRGGEVFIRCPFESEHSGGREVDPGTSTAYFPAGTGGYANGHFKCLHAHCAGRSDSDYVDALGIIAAGFDIVNLSDEELISHHNQLEYSLKMNDEGKIIATVSNLQAILMNPQAAKQYIRWDNFRGEIVWKLLEDNSWSPFKDTDYTRLRVELERTGFLPVGSHMIKDVVHRVAELNKFDTAIEWLNELPEWDGVKRVSRFMSDYMGVESSAYTTAVSEYTWVALAGRVLDPGCKADAAPVFIGEQYSGKSLAIECMAPDPRMFVEIKLDDNEDNLSRKIRGKLIAELSELRGLHTKEIEGIKAYISRRCEEWVPKYMEFSTIYPRRLIFIGTSNKDEIFADETGERRWFPLATSKGDCESIKRDRDQLWAESRNMFKKTGSVKDFYEKANRLAKNARENFAINDAWESIISQWLDDKELNEQTPRERDFLHIADILKEALAYDYRNIKHYDTMRVAKILKKEGYQKIQKLIGGKNIKVWVKES